MKRNPNLAKLESSYLFVEINKRKQAYLNQHPEAKLISLGIGDTVEPISEPIVKAMMHASLDQGIREKYQGYGPEVGILELRENISETLYSSKINPEDIFISDGAKCDVGRLQVLFGQNLSIGVQDPSYPVYVDGSRIQGINQIHLMPCTPENHFFPDLQSLPHLDLLYICSPNNPTGEVYTKEQLQKLVDYAKENNTLILFDAAYSSFISNPEIPKSIYEIEGAKEVAIETQSFSKNAGFTGIRLGFTIVPKELKYEDGFSIQKDWKRVISTLFNGASIISQKGGIAALSPIGIEASKLSIQLYQENASLLKEALKKISFEVYGAEHSPYIWARTPGLTSWEAFQLFLEEAQIVTTPGSGFGKSGEGFIRLSAFSSRESILDAIKRFEALPSLLTVDQPV